MGEIILRAISLIITGVLACYIIPYLKKHKLYKAVKIAVQAAQQMFTDTGIDKKILNAQKFNYVWDCIKKCFKVSDDELKNIIESAVYELKAGEG